MSAAPIVKGSVMRAPVKNREQTSLVFSDGKEKEGLAAMTNSTISSAATSSAPSLTVNSDELPSLDSLRGQMPGSPKAIPTSSPALAVPSKPKTEEAQAKAKQEALQALKRHGEIDNKARKHPLLGNYLSAEISMRFISTAVPNHHLNDYNNLREWEFQEMRIDEACRKHPASKIREFAGMPKEEWNCYRGTNFDRTSHGNSIQSTTRRFYSAWKAVYDSKEAMKLFADQENIAQCKKDMEPYLSALPLDRADYSFPRKVVSSLEKEIDALAFSHSTKFRLYQIAIDVARSFWSKKYQQQDSKTKTRLELFPLAAELTQKQRMQYVDPSHC